MANKSQNDPNHIRLIKKEEAPNVFNFVMDVLAGPSSSSSSSSSSFLDIPLLQTEVEQKQEEKPERIESDDNRMDRTEDSDDDNDIVDKNLQIGSSTSTEKKRSVSSQEEASSIMDGISLENATSPYIPSDIMYEQGDSSEKPQRKKKIFGNRFPSEEEDQKYQKVIEETYEARSSYLKDVTYIILSGLYGAGKDTCGNIIEHILHSQGVNVIKLSFAKPLKDSVASLMCVDRNSLDNVAVEDRAYMNDPYSDHTLFWTVGLLESKYTKNNSLKFYSDGYEPNLCKMDDDTILSVIKNDDTWYTKILPDDTVQEISAQQFQTNDQKIECIFSKIKRFKEHIKASIKEMKPSNQFMNHICDPNLDGGSGIDTRLFPSTPRVMLEFIGTELIRKCLSKDFFVLSNIRKVMLLIKERKAKKVHGCDKPWVVLLTDGRFRNEVVLPAQYGAKVLYFYIERESIMNESPVYTELNKHIESVIKHLDPGARVTKTHTSSTSLHQRRVPSQSVCTNFVSNFIKNHNANKNNVPLAPVPLVRWIPLLLKHYMREKFGTNHIAYNKANGLDIVSFKIINEEMDASNRKSCVEKLTTLFYTYLQSQNVIE